MTKQYLFAHMIGRIFVNFDIKTLTGLHIGGAAGTLAIGNVDNPVIRNPFNNEPYIPGSSLRGKMRSQLEKHCGLIQNNEIGNMVRIHTATTIEQYNASPIPRVFGVPASDKFATEPTRLIVRDANLSKPSKDDFQTARTDLPYTEVKWEAAIDRVTSAATPRQQERVPAGVIFNGALTFTLYNDFLNDPETIDFSKDAKLFNTVIEGLKLVEDDYLGGQGARGSGQVRFENITIKVQRQNQADFSSEKLESIDELKRVWDKLGLAKS